MNILVFFTSMLLAVNAMADMVPVSDQQLEQTSGQAGITLSAKIEFGSGTRLSYSNKSASAPVNSTWMVIDELTGSVEFKGLDIDLVDGIGPLKDKSALQLTLPEEVRVNNLNVDGVYFGNSVTRQADSRFFLGLSADGTLQLPARSRLQIFPAEKVITGQ